jgi:hypothetical protein
MRITYWLYYGQRVLTAVRAQEGKSHDEVRAIAIDAHNRVPLSSSSLECSPVEFRSMLFASTVKTFLNGN